jgi:hypothetical protein
MMIPTIHLSGTSADELFRQVAEAGGALRRALDAMTAAEPHGRDYYPQGPAALPAALREHRNRIELVRAILAEYQQLAEAIADVRDARRSKL